MQKFLVFLIQMQLHTLTKKAPANRPWAVQSLVHLGGSVFTNEGVKLNGWLSEPESNRELSSVAVYQRG